MDAPRRRSAFADRLLSYPDFAFGDDRIVGQRGRWRAFFEKRIGPRFDGRVVLEVGCFDGAFLARLAAKRPGTAFVGLDWKHKALYIAAERVAAAGLNNVALLRGRGQDLTAMFGDGEVDEILLLHPDPFAEPEALPNRLFAEPFLRDVHAVLRSAGSTLTLKTDHPGYYAWALALFGMPEPGHFEASRVRALADSASAHRLFGTPRVRAADLLAKELRPIESAVAKARFGVTVASADYWNDPVALAHTADRVFADERTFFEERFLRKRQPIYYFEIAKRAASGAANTV